VTKLDVNVHDKATNVTSGLTIAGFGGSVQSGGIFTDDYVNQTLTDLYNNQITPNSSTILLTYGGPAYFSTTLNKTTDLSIDFTQIAPQNWTETGTPSLTTLLYSDPRHTILNVHGNNPTGVGNSNYGDVEIVNPGVPQYTNTLAVIEVYAIDNTWVVDSWKFYRFGNLTLDPPNYFTTTLSASCSITNIKNIGPYINNIYSQISIAFYTAFTVIIIGLTVLWITVLSKGSARTGGDVR